MLTYGSEIWGYENIDILEKGHVQFCKLLLNLKTSTPNFMLYGELGRYPVNITVKLKILSFWSKLIDGKQSKLSSLIYRLLYLKTGFLRFFLLKIYRSKMNHRSTYWEKLLL
jgi:hypothetical protein